jgi:hypothetical protein
MALADGDYLAIADKVVETLTGDTSEGGLCEENFPAVKTIEPRIRREAKLYSKYELPLIGVEVVRKREKPGPSSRLVDKHFDLEFLVLCRGGDRELETRRAKKIAARLECLIREQNESDQQFAGLPPLIEGSQGTLLALVKETSFESRFFEDGNDKNPEVTAVVSAEIMVPADFLL